ncbi:MAG TPA: hypothetical protein VNI84_19050 [Pyrinomonadaceae bacterium]|nr:hypothetical protein [Pyrinomonadaceae bacterium]
MTALLNICRAFKACLFPVRLFIFLIIGLLFTSSISAQTALTGSLRGVVSDANGAAIPGVVVKIEINRCPFDRKRRRTRTGVS